MGREAELALAAVAVGELGEGRASVLAIEGEAGIGKTRVVQSIVDDARARDLAVFSGQAHPFERTRPFGVVAAALDLSRRSSDPRRAAIGALLAGDRAAAPAAAVGDVQYQVVEEIVDLVESSCAAATGGAGGRGRALGRQREPAGDLVGGAAPAAVGVARRGDRLGPRRCRPRWSGCSMTFRPRARARCNSGR